MSHTARAQGAGAEADATDASGKVTFTAGLNARMGGIELNTLCVKNLMCHLPTFSDFKERFEQEFLA